MHEKMLKIQALTMLLNNNRSVLTEIRDKAQAALASLDEIDKQLDDLEKLITDDK